MLSRCLKSIFKIILVLVACFALALGVNALRNHITDKRIARGNDGLIYELSNNDYTYTVIGLENSTDETIVIPETFEGVTVRSIGEGAFQGCNTITRVKIPDSVTSIENFAFANCSSLEEIVIPDSVKTIGKNAFADCDGMKAAIVGDGLTSLGAGVFLDCNSLKTVRLGYSLTSIGADAFSGCSNLTTLTIPANVTYLGKGVLNGCDSLEYNEYQGAYYFSQENNPYAIMLALKSNDALSCVVHNDTKVISAGIFDECDNLTDFSTPLSLISSLPQGKVRRLTLTAGEIITSDAFNGFSNLQSLDIGDSVTSIEYEAFKHCSALLNVTIGKNVQYIGWEAFYHCYRLVEVVNKSQYLYIWRDSSSDGCVGYYALDVYNSGIVFAGTKLSNENGYIIYTDEGERILVGYTGTENELVLPSNITKINRNAFYNYGRLTSITIPDNVTEIGENAFEGCSITEATMPALAIQYIPKENLQKAVITSGETIPSSGFEYSPQLTSVTIADRVTSIEYGAFFNCTRLTEVNIGAGVTSIGSSAFYGCRALTSVVIGKGVTAINYSAFTGCSVLTNVYYKGTESDWANISMGGNNKYLTDATRYLYKETEPALNADGTAYDGNYWHYDDNDQPVAWVFVGSEE
ncbi:MAG: leucine-rich repeat domain-containing protein [Clostridiales bacterium]|nr:leucine-rich repeat domain-containing protein [Clostridiales bacterium]